MNTQRKRCGKCGQTIGMLFPVIVTTRGIQSESWAHAVCMEFWRKTASVIDDMKRGTVVQGKYKYVRRKQPQHLIHTYSSVWKGDL